MSPEPAHCRGCNRKVYFARSENGKTQILDASAPTYELVTDPLTGETTARRAVAFVSHYATCPKASEFGKGRR